MGKGDKKTGKGKRSMGSYGNTRMKKKNVPSMDTAPTKKSTAKKEVTVKAEVKKPIAKKAAPKKSKESNEK